MRGMRQKSRKTFLKLKKFFLKRRYISFLLEVVVIGSFN